MVNKNLIINETTFFLTRHYLNHYIYHNIYKIDTESQDIKLIHRCNEHCEEKEGDEKCDESKDKEKKEEVVDPIKSISLLNERIGDGINNVDSIIENTKYAGEEINYSFQILTQNLDQFNKQLNNRNNNNI